VTQSKYTSEIQDAHNYSIVTVSKGIPQRIHVQFMHTNCSSMWRHVMRYKESWCTTQSRLL